MAGGEDKNRDYYAVLGLNKECSTSELRDAYKKLAMRWHPDRCSSSGNSRSMEESKRKFQAIQQAYSVLSDTNKRFLYDVEVYEIDDDDGGMGDFLNEMAVMMSRTQPSENGDGSFEQLQELFDEMFHDDMEAFATTSSSSMPSPFMSYRVGSNLANNNTGSSSSFNGGHFQSFCLGTMEQGRGLRKRKGREGIMAPEATTVGGNRSKRPCGLVRDQTGDDFYSSISPSLNKNMRE